MSLSKKSQENFSLANRLSTTGPLHIAVSRLYYSVYQAVVFKLKQKKFDYKQFLSKNPGYRNTNEYAHESIGDALASFVLSQQLPGRTYILHNFDWLKDQRIRADYKNHFASQIEFQRCITVRNKIDSILQRV